MPVAAENPAGGLAGAGVGVGMGMAMAQRFDPNTGGTAAGGPLSPPPPPAPPAPWFIVENGQSVGPFNQEQLAQAVGAGRVSGETLVWTAGKAEWLAARQAPPVAALLANAPPPPPVA